jgi:hypothetical protein
VPTLRQHEKRLRKIIRLVDRIHFNSDDEQAGEILFTEGAIHVLWIDPFWRGIGTTVIHELIHYERRVAQRKKDGYHEPDTLGSEAAMWDLISKDNKLHPWWRKQIYKRLPDSLKGVK